MAALLVVVAGMTTSCGVVSYVTGIEFEPYYSAEQRAAYRSALEIATRLEGIPPITEDEWSDMYKLGENICQGLKEDGLASVRSQLADGLVSSAPGASPERAALFVEMFINAATAQGSMCP
ncbi:MAG: hypothetical protein Q7V58_06845 [Actinomycetota bacterium]|nr:hypothetical protein [Actinomycetota bacterium]